MKFTHLFTALVLGGAALAGVRCGDQTHYEESAGGAGAGTGSTPKGDGGTQGGTGGGAPREGGGTHPW